MTKRDALRVVCHGMALWFAATGVLGIVTACFQALAIPREPAVEGTIPMAVVLFSYPVMTLIVAVYLWFAAGKLSSVFDDSPVATEGLTPQAVQRVLFCTIGVYFLVEGAAALGSYAAYLLRGVPADAPYMDYLTRGRFNWYSLVYECVRLLLGLFLIFGPAWPKNVGRSFANALWRVPTEGQIRERERPADEEQPPNP